MRKKQKKINPILVSERFTLVELDFNFWFDLQEEPLTYDIKGQLTKRLMGEWEKISHYPDLSFYLNQVIVVNDDLNNPDKSFYKLNGRIRKKLWESGVLDRPETLLAQVVRLKNPEFSLLSGLIYPVSARAAIKTSIIDIYQELGLSFQSTRLKHGNIAEALNICLRGSPAHLQDRRTYKEINLKSAIELFREELILLDDLMIDQNIFVTGVLAAALIFLGINKNNIIFFDQLNKNEVHQKNDSLNPVGALIKMINYLKSTSGSQSKIQVELCSKTANCILAFQNGPDSNKYWIKQLRNISLAPYIRKMREIKGITKKRDL